MSMMGQLMKPRKTEITGLFVTDFAIIYIDRFGRGCILC